MKPRTEGGVVDSHLNVHGVHGLKIAGMLFRQPSQMLVSFAE